MRARSAVIAAVVLGLAATTPAAAAKKKKPKPPAPLCNLMLDPAGDGQWRVASAVESKALDIVSGDVATGPKQFVAVLRVASTDLKDDKWVSLGYQWVFGASGNGIRYEFKATMGPGSSSSTKPLTSVVVGGQSITPHEFKVVNDTLVWTFDRKLAPVLAKPGIVWTELGAQSKAFGSTADSVDASPRRYPDRHPSCVKAL